VRLFSTSEAMAIEERHWQTDGDSNISPRRATWRGRRVTAETQALLDEDARYFLHQSLSTPCLSAVAKAEGIWIEDFDGRRYMDFHGNNVHHIGYGHPRLVAAIKAQLDALTFAPRRFTNEPAIALARKLTEITPGPLEKVLLATGGSDAIEIALKLARLKTGRHKTISFWDSFHGAGFAASSVGGEDTFRSGPIGPLMAGTEHVPPFSCYRCPYGYEDIDGKPDLDTCHMTCANMLRYVLEKESDVAAVIAEPIRSISYVPPPGFWQSVREACDEYGALLIFDEIPAGLGKTGRMFVYEHFDVVPDILVLGKPLGGGVLPISAVIARSELDVGGNWALGHYTHEKNPVTSAAALTTIEIIEDEGLVENARVVGAYALDLLEAMKSRHPLIGDVRGLGLLLGVELVQDRESKSPACDAAEAVMYRCLDKGLSFKTTLGNVLALTPPLITTVADMDYAVAILDAAIGEVEADRRV
jgi:4-aminobutyrate aminotransferase